jgi:hypothetical protein
MEGQCADYAAIHAAKRGPSPTHAHLWKEVVILRAVKLWP